MSTSTGYGLPRKLFMFIVGCAVVVAVITAIGAGNQSSRKSSAVAPESPGLVKPKATADASTSKSADNAVAGQAFTTEATEAGRSNATGSSGIADSDMPTGTTEPAPTTSDTDLGLRIVRNGSIDLQVRTSQFDQAAREAERVATRYGGYVSQSSREGAGKDARSANITLRIPAKRFDDAIDDLRAGDGKVMALSITSDDVTSEYVDAESRLRHQKAVEARLLTLLAKTKTVGEALSIQTRLDSVQQQIEIEKGQLKMYDRLTTFATIEVSIATKAAAVKKRDDGESWGVRDAFDDAAHAFVDSFSRGIVAVGGALPTLLMLLVIGLVGRGVWRRKTARNAQAATDMASRDV